MMLFCSHISDNDIEVRFYRTDSTGAVVWESVVDIKRPMCRIHKGIGISIMAPAYESLQIRKSFNIYLQLRRPSDHKSCKPIAITYLPHCGYHNCHYMSYALLTNLNINMKLPCFNGMFNLKSIKLKFTDYFIINMFDNFYVKKE